MKAQLLNVTELTSEDMDAMYQLLDTHFSGVSSEVFVADLLEKHWVLLLLDEITGRLQGFTTMRVDQFDLNGESVYVVSSGDTIVDPDAWGSSSLPKAWVTAIQQIRQDYPQERFYWLLICSGYRTYRFLPVFAQQFYPRYDRPTPSHHAAMMQQFAAKRYQHFYDVTTGIVQFPHPQRLRDRLKGIPDGRLSDPHIAFFEQINPGYDRGDELVCLTEICESNLTAAGRRIWMTHQRALVEV
ncbi:MAG: hypothetical protein RLZZ511_69 [Cyanobacteriota bacterium]|jgi:hypothetical protein